VKRAMVDIVLHDIETYDYGAVTARDADGRPSFRAGDPTGGSLGFLVALLPSLKRMLEKMNLTDQEREQLWRDMLEHSFIAADSSPRMVRLGRLNMALQGAPRAKVFNTANSLTTPLLKPGTFDLIMTNPPFGKPKAKKAEEKKAVAALMAQFRSDVDFEAVGGKGGVMTPSPDGLAMGCKPNNKGVWSPKDSGVDLSVLFLDRCLQLLKPGGRLVMVVPDSLLCNANTRYVREYLIGKKDEATGEFHGGKAIVKAVVSLPADTFKLSGTGAKTSILYVQKRRAQKDAPERFIDEPQTDVLMAVADTLGYIVKNNQEEYRQGGKFIPNDLVPIVGAYVRGE
jgi:type I restriction enzyme M protein